MTVVTQEVASPAALSLPQWPEVPEPVDPSGRSFEVFGFGDGAAVARAWSDEARSHGPVGLVVAATFEVGAVRSALVEARCGVRVMICGPQDDVLLALAEARSVGAEPEELRSFVTRDDVLPIFCAHCRGTHRVAAVPGGTVECPGCARVLEVHPHLSAVRGSFLASDARARELAP